MMTAAAAAVLMLGCGQSGTATKPAAAPSDVAVPQSGGLDIGDAEHHLAVEARLAAEAKSPTITSEDLVDDTKNLTMVTLTVGHPVPDSLPISFSLRSTEDFGTSPVVVLGTALRDDQPMGEFHTVAGLGARSLPARAAGQAPAVWTFDVLDGLESVPETMLVNARITLKLAPQGTSEADIDPLTFQVGPDSETIEFSNPVRINFAPAPAVAAAEAPVEAAAP
jgi:hypothetical protein